MNNQGLEALAALASAAPAPSETPTPIEKDESKVVKDERAKEDKPAPQHGQEISTAASNPFAAPGALDPAKLSSLLPQFMSNTSISSHQMQQLLSAAGIMSSNPGPNAAPAPATTPATTPAFAQTLPWLANMQQLQQQPAQSDPSTLMALQQFMYYQQLIKTFNPQQASQMVHAINGNQPVAQASNPVAASSLTERAPFQNPTFLKNEEDSKPSAAAQVLPAPSAPAPAQAQNSTHGMPPPRPQLAAGTQPISVSTAGIASPAHVAKPPLAPQPALDKGLSNDDRSGIFNEHPMFDKKQQKRAANRRSAQLSRKRKKLFIEELKDENDELRRKEQILKSIPDLIVVFDSSGKLWFVSKSVSRFLKFSAHELEGTSFWERLCDDSVRLLKAAFMDSLAARNVESDTAPLGKGFWELRLVDSDGTQKVVHLNGVVHFAGERPECVCSIRPRDDAEVGKAEKATAAVSGGSESSDWGEKKRPFIRVKPQQSVVSNGGSDSSSSRQKLGRAMRISDSGNSSVESESGSSDETNGES